MAKPDCEVCAMIGLRACDNCGNVIPPYGCRDALGRELCAYCR